METEDSTSATSVITLKELIAELGWVVIKDEYNNQLLYGPTAEEANITHSQTVRKMFVQAAKDGFIPERKTQNWQWEQGSDHLQFAEALVKKYIEEQENPTITIFIKAITGKTLTLQVKVSDTIAMIKTMIEEKDGYREEQYVSNSNGIKLENDRALSDYNITNDSQLWESGRVRGGTHKATYPPEDSS